MESPARNHPSTRERNHLRRSQELGPPPANIGNSTGYPLVGDSLGFHEAKPGCPTETCRAILNKDNGPAVLRDGCPAGMPAVARSVLALRLAYFFARLTRLRRRRSTMMRLVRGVGGRVGEHRFDGGGQRLQTNQA